MLFIRDIGSGTGRLFFAGAGLLDDLFYVFQEFGYFVDVTVFDGVSDSSTPAGFAPLVDTGSRWVEQFEIAEGVAIDKDEVGFISRTDSSKFVGFSEDEGAVGGGVLDDIQGVKTCFLVQF
jgi:hypothetical protein